MEAEGERLQREKAREDLAATQRFVVKRNDEDAVQSARERYRERKRQRLETDEQVKPDD
jgi:hypothetical protein